MIFRKNSDSLLHSNVIFNAFITLIWLILSPALLNAQNAEHGRSIQTEFTCVSWNKPISSALYVRNGEEMVPLRIHNMQRSQSMEYSGLNPVVFHTKTKNDHGETIYKPIAEASIPIGIEKPLLFFVENEDQYQIIALEDSFAQYPNGSYRFYNFTEKDLLAKFGEQTINLKPKKTIFLEQPFNTSKEYPVAFVLRDPDGVKPLYTNKWRHSENFRYLIFVSESGSRDVSPIQFKVLADYPISN
ncbi:hypothetical protein [Cerasicoccus maritimus]|uniref:hypothetical protein n=1 Tax=Cerasicoccus maritimus TaxID=490089 RepID=UPI002852B747|nr:hypothetical protein [Cerasicoccus maritimus]